VYYLGLPSQTQILQNPAKPSQGEPKENKEKSLDFLGFSWPNWVFSKGCSDPLGEKFLSRFPSRRWLSQPGRASIGDRGKVSRLLIFAKRIRRQSDEG
jgi:hypothetical protein